MHAAQVLGVTDQGAIEPGLRADIVAMPGNPLEDIAVLQRRDNLKLIMKGGRVVKNRLDQNE